MAVTDLAPSFTIATDGSQAASGAVTGFNGVVTGGGTQVGSADFLPGRGDRSINFDATSTSGALYGTVNVSTDTVAMDYPFMLSSIPGAETAILWFGAASTRQCSIAIVGSDAGLAGAVRVRSAATSALQTATVALTLDKWYLIRVAIGRDAAAGTMRVSVHDGLTATPIFDTGALTGLNTGANPFTSFRVGGRASTGTQVIKGKYGPPRYDDTSSALLAMPAAATNYVVSPSDSLGATDAAAVSRGYNVAANDGASLTDNGTDATTAYGVAVADVVPAGDSVSTLTVRGVSASDPLGASDAGAASLGLSRSAADPLGASDVAAYLDDETSAPADASPAVDAASASMAASRTADDPLGGSDAVGAVLTRAASPADPLPATDAAASSASSARAADDPLGASDSVSVVLTSSSTAAPGDNLPATDTAGAQSASARSASDPLGASDSVSATLQSNPTASPADPLAGSDSVSATMLNGYDRAFADPLPAADLATSVVDAVRAAADSLPGADLAASSAGASSGPVDSSASADSASATLAMVRPVGDTSPASDGLQSTMAASRSQADSATVVDSVGVELVLAATFPAWPLVTSLKPEAPNVLLEV